MLLDLTMVFALDARRIPRYSDEEMTPKQRAANEALRYVREGMVVGLGSGSTSECFVRALGEALRTSKIRKIRGVATSVGVENLARELGIPMTTLTECGVVDVSVDGADEIDPRLNLIKGLGGALVREKVIEQNSRRFICIADASKLVGKLGTKGPLPVEVLPFCHDTHISFFHSLGGTPRLRVDDDGDPFISDNGNYIYHLTFNGGIESPVDVDRKLHARAGVVDTGLFISMAEMAIIADEQGVKILKH